MFLIYGTRTARIKRYKHEQQPCKDCASYDMQVKVYRQYYHAFFIPIVPIGDKHTEIRCNCCGAPMMLTVVKQHYEKSTRTPFYLYTSLILLASAIALVIYANLNTQKEKRLFIANPQTDDVYTIRIDENYSKFYFFLRVLDVRDDTIVVCRNKKQYYRFVNKLDNDDSFIQGEENRYSREELKDMLERGIINAVTREYSAKSGFDRMEY